LELDGLMNSILQRVLAALVVAGVMFAPGGGKAPLQAYAQGRALVFFTPVRGTLNDATPVEDWTFAGQADEVVSLLAVAQSGDLDPVLQVIGPTGEIVGENDDLDSIVVDAGLEAFTLPSDGTYTARVMRYQGAAGTTTGEYELTLTPGFARLAYRSVFDGGIPWVTPGDEPVPAEANRLPLRVTSPDETLLAFPPNPDSFGEMYAQVRAQVDGAPSYAEFGLVFRAQGPGLVRSYQFKVNSHDQWTVLYQDESGIYVLRSWSTNPALSPSNQWTLAVLAGDREFAFYANGTLLGTLSDGRLPTPGAIGVLAASNPHQPDPPTVMVDDVVVTTRLGTTYHGLPLALSTWDSSDPGAIVNSLANSGQVIPAAARDLFLPERSLTATTVDAQFALIGSDRALYDNFVLGARVSMTTGGQSVGCGLVYRWADARNLDLAYVDTAGGFGVVQARDGQLTTNVYDRGPMVDKNADKLLVVVQGDRVALYVNGALVTQETAQPGEGRVGVALLNYEDVRTDCHWSDIWVWPLEERQP
jgi:hypothetical protein